MSYLELLSTGTPAAAFTGARRLISGRNPAWVLAPRLSAIPYLNPDELLVCAPSVKEAYWVTEQALRYGAIDVVILVLDRPYDLTQSRRLKLATEIKGVQLIVILPGSVQSFNSAAQERWHLVSKVSDQPHRSLSVWDQLKNKRGSLVKMEVSDHARHVSVA